MHKTITAGEPLVFRRSAARRWLQRVDLLFYALLVTAIGAFGYYLYYYLTTPLIHGLSGNVAMEIYLPFLLQHAGLTILISLVSMALATLSDSWALKDAWPRFLRLAGWRPSTSRLCGVRLFWSSCSSGTLGLPRCFLAWVLIPTMRSSIS